MQSLTIYKIIDDDKVAVKLPVRVKIRVQLFSKFDTSFASVLNVAVTVIQRTQSSLHRMSKLN